MTKCYTGVGSRQTPTDICNLFTEIACSLRVDYTLRSGGAEGADKAFELGAGRRSDIYLPWKGFNKSKSSLYNICDESLRVAADVHPNWRACSEGAKKLHARNVYQLLGDDLENPTPSEFVICWTHNGRTWGGTSTVIRLARQHRVPIYNFGSQPTLEKWKKHGLNLFLKGL